VEKRGGRGRDKKIQIVGTLTWNMGNFEESERRHREGEFLFSDEGKEGSMGERGRVLGSVE